MANRQKGLSFLFEEEKQIFLNKHYDKKPFIKKNKLQYREVFEISDFDFLLTIAESQNVRLVKNQEYLNPNKFYKSNGLDISRVYYYYTIGYSIVFLGVNKLSLSIKRLCQELREESGFIFAANLYLSPSNSKALELHYDAHDVFVLQVAGNKKWKLYPSSSKPLLNTHQPIIDSESFIKTLKDIELSEGDLMYIPRGVPHEAFSTDSFSLHMSIGVYPIQYYDILNYAQNINLGTINGVEDSLPWGYNNTRDNSLIINKLKDLATKVTLQNMDYKAVINELMSENNIVLNGFFNKLNRLDEIHEKTIIKKVIGIDFKLIEHTGKLQLEYNGRVINLSLNTRDSIQFIINRKKNFKVKDIPGQISIKSKLKLIRELISRACLDF
jgi:ribosomal protein L16 Arg81 hydroxylase